MGDMRPSSSESIPTAPAASTAITNLELEVHELYTENVAAKIFNVAKRLRKEQSGILLQYPESVPQSGPTTGTYSLRDAEFWTCGFFPGSLYALLERSTKHPQHLPLTSIQPTITHHQFRKQLLEEAKAWAEPLYAMAKRTDTHDMAFIIQPALRMDWELLGNESSLNAVIEAAESLASRYDDKVRAIRSWDQAINKRYSYTDMESDFLVIVDSMCNLDLLYYAGHHTGNTKLIDLATTHAKTVLRTIVRGDWSTFHLVNFDAKNGAVKAKLTNQGFKDSSTWSRGQAWAILGFAQTYVWTKDKAFLNAAIALADYFLNRLDASSHPSPYVPVWDFNAPIENPPLRDTSAGMIAANGLLLIYQAMQGQGDALRYLSAAVRITKETNDLSLSKDNATLGDPEKIEFDAILRNATACANEDSLRRYWDHGLVYADYYFLELGNKFIRMGLV